MKDYFIINQKKLMLQEAFCIAVSIIIAMVIEISFNFKGFHGYWIPMTVAIMFIGPSQGSMVKRSSDRIFGTFLGLIFGFLYVNILMYSDYRWGYLLPFIWFILFYVNGITGNYCITVIIATMFLPIVFAVLYPSAFSVGATLLVRLSFTGVGVMIALLCEFLIYKKAALSSGKLKKGIHEYFRIVSEIIKMSNEHFIEAGVSNREFRIVFKKMLTSISSIEGNYINFRYELDYNKDHEDISVFLFQSIEQINLRLRKMLCINGHNKFDAAAYDKEEFSNICKLIELKYKHIGKYVHGKKDDTSDVLNSFIKNNSCNVFSTLLYAKEMYELSKTFDELTEFIYDKKYSE
jgi:hypothetical protein